MITPIESKAPTSLSAANLTPRGKVGSSPEDWRDQFFYFLLPDRFSDGGEAVRSLFDLSAPHINKSFRNEKSLTGLTLRKGRQYLRETSFLGRPFSFPGAGELIGWSRILANKEVVVILNSHGTEERGADVTVDAVLQADTDSLSFLYHNDWDFGSTIMIPSEQSTPIYQSAGRFFIHIALPPAGMAILS